MMHPKLSILVLSVLFLAGCHRTTLEDLAANTASEYTERNCPTPVQNCQRTDSVTFSRDTHTFSYYYSLSDKLDNPVVIERYKKQIVATILCGLKENTSLKEYKEAGYNFRYVMRSSSTGNVLVDKMFTQKDYK